MEGRIVVIAASGTLDGEGGQLLQDAVRAAATSRRAEQVELDLRRLTRMTSGGLTALAECVRLGEEEATDVQFRFGADQEHSELPAG